MQVSIRFLTGLLSWVAIKTGDPLTIMYLEKSKLIASSVMVELISGKSAMVRCSAAAWLVPSRVRYVLNTSNAMCTFFNPNGVRS